MVFESDRDVSYPKAYNIYKKLGGIRREIHIDEHNGDSRKMGDL